MPGLLYAGVLEPVTMDSSTLESPLITHASAGNFFTGTNQQNIIYRDFIGTDFNFFRHYVTASLPGVASFTSLWMSLTTFSFCQFLQIPA